MSTGTVTWAGVTVITPAQGEYDFTPGLLQPVWKMERPVRCLGEFAKHLGAIGCDHVMRVTYLNIAPGTGSGQVMAFMESLQNMVCPATGSPSSGSLVVPDHGTWPHCVIMGIAPGPQTARTTVQAAVTAGALYKTQVYDLEYTITFHQTRR